MYVTDTNAPTTGLRVPGMSDDYRESGVDIPERGAVQVDAQTGEALIEHCPTITDHEPDDTGAGDGGGGES